MAARGFVLRRALSTWLPVVAWAALIFWLSSIPGLGTGLGVWDLVLRKLAHFVEFAILGALLARALPELYALAGGVAYAVTDELHQHLVPARVGALGDVAIDAVGVLVGILVWRRLGREQALLAGLRRHRPRRDDVGEDGDGDEHRGDAQERARAGARTP